jgi:hypothetical protein
MWTPKPGQIVIAIDPCVMDADDLPDCDCTYGDECDCQSDPEEALTVGTKYRVSNKLTIVNDQGYKHSFGTGWHLYFKPYNLKLRRRNV